MIQIKLSPGELLFIGRRRSNRDQGEEALSRNVQYKIYRAWEVGKLIPDFELPQLAKLEDIEQCIILRKRKGLTQKALSMLMNVSRYWIGEMENGSVNPQRLIAYWDEE